MIDSPPNSASSFPGSGTSLKGERTDSMLDVDYQQAEVIEKKSHSTSSPEIIIIGAGIAGCALAYSLSHTGRRILLIERDLTTPDRIVGELLQPGGVNALQQLGMEECLQGIDATPVEGYCVVMGERTVPIPYPELEAMAGENRESITSRLNTSSTPPAASAQKTADAISTSGKQEGRSFHHGRFIDALRRKVIQDAPGVQVVEGSARNLITCDHTRRVIGVQVAVKNKNPSKAAVGGEENQDDASMTVEDTVVRNFYAPLTIIADGCFSKFRNAATGSPSETTGDIIKKKILPPVKPIKTRSHFVGAVLKDVPLPSPRHGTVCLTPNGPVLLYQIADKAGETRMLVDVKGKLPSVGDGSLRTHIETNYLPHLPQQFHPSIKQALSTDRLRTMPNSFLPPKMQGRRGAREGVIMVGDSWNMRHPLTGGGMTVALHDAVLLTDYLKPSDELVDLHDWEVIAARLQDWYWKRKHLAGVVNVLSIALYDLFGADDQNLSVLREGCFGYFELGGDCVAGPVGLLSALTPKPLLLFYHFFAVAFYSLWLLFTQPFGERKHAPYVSEYPGLVVQSAQVFWAACVVLLPVIWSEITV
ncbi:hypothetical protein QFC22_005545 [Naganishia vaughanmartiniae]|uniref:Uncharacterized protein n=1 Tax=Naganishia vaughanmartiniae TaxID=1424756 RepID=A0ACC2WSC8_9TREE|nr:hypothetical protein QFC22_005545 [Naganishia vaughanmartiniae]